jgi:hypothetical protein
MPPVAAPAGPAAELRAYLENAFLPAALQPPALPLADEPFVEAWARYAADAERRGVLAALRDALVQLSFPVAAGMSGDAAYLAATRRGDPAPEGPGLVLEHPEGLRLFLHPTAAGRLPVIVAPHRPDFEALVRALSRRGEPAPVPRSQGACIVAGYVNWGRVGRLRAAFEAGEAIDGLEGAAGWAEAFTRLRDRRELYQDRFVLLSDGPYSGVPAGEMGMEEGAWRAASLAIRLEHESAHYFTRRALGSMKNALHDELIADYAGIVAAEGRYRADWFLRFLGADGEGGYRAGGRLENYRGDPPLSDAAFAALLPRVRRAAAAVEAFDATLGPDDRTVAGRARVLVALAACGVREMAAPDGAGRLRARLDAVPRGSGRSAPRPPHLPHGSTP